MIRIKHPSSSQELSVPNGAYAQMYKPLGWTPVEAEKKHKVNKKPEQEAPPTPPTPKRRRTKAEK